MDWFQKNDSSELLYILTEDITKVDFFFNEVKMDFIECVLNLFIAFLICNILLWVIITVPMLIGAWMFMDYFKPYLMATQYFYGLEGKTQSELLSIYLQTFDGVIMFRNMGNLTFFDSRFIDATESYQRATTHLNNISGRYIGIRRMFLNTYFIFLVYTIPIIIKEGFQSNTLWLWTPWVTPLAVSWAVRMVRYTNQIFGVLGLMARYMLSIKRIENFLNHREVEDLDPGMMKDDKNSNIAIEFKNASMSYGFNKKSLWDMNGIFEKGKRIAVVGASNSGKHSLINMLLKLYERIDADEEQSRFSKQQSLFNNTTKWWNEHYNELEAANREKYPIGTHHPDRADPNSRGDAFQVWSSFVTKIEAKPKGPEKFEGKTENIDGDESYIKVLGVELGDCSPFELRRHCGYLSANAKIYNGTLLDNIDFFGDFEHNKWKIVKIMHFLGFFEAWKESMNMDDAFGKFQETMFKPSLTIDINKKQFDEEEDA
jgi:ABC-type multidrug transport system fused ATPase/permease subunit